MSEFKRSVRFWSIGTGVSLIVMAVAAGIAYGVIFPSFYVEGDPVATALNIEANPADYNIGILLWGIILVTDLLVTWGFFRFLFPMNKSLAITSGGLRLVYSAILGLAVAMLIGRDPDSFLSLWSAGLFLFGFHLVVTGVAVLRSTLVLKILGILLIVAGVGYSLTSGAQILVPDSSELVRVLEAVLAIPMTVGEMAFGLWLLLRGGKSTSRQASGHHAPGAV